jgi:ribonuclease-3
MVSPDVRILDQTPPLSELEAIVEYHFQNQDLLETCLTHASVSKTRLNSNERLEFLGDAVLGLSICQILFERYPEQSEGEMTRIKSIVVSRETCAQVGKEMGIGRFIRLGKGLSQGDVIPSSIVAGVFESLIAGIYLDGGVIEARRFIERVLDLEIRDAAEKNYTRNYKSLLQQLSQKNFGETPKYILLDEKGPDHSKCFKVTAAIGEKNYGPAWGANKKEAEQRAATNAIYEIEGKTGPYMADE